MTPRIVKPGAMLTVGLVTCLALAMLVRLPSLGRRPMHNDEANQAYKAGRLLEEGTYRYDPAEHHGPTLYYLTLPLAWARGQFTFAETDIATYRGLTVLFGLLLVPLLFLVRDALGMLAAAVAAVLTALSPAMVYFSRFYIQEMLLVCFTFALLVCLWRYARRPCGGWAVGAGVSAGLMHATKETCVLAWSALGAAVVLNWLLSGRRRRAGGGPTSVFAKAPRRDRPVEESGGTAPEARWSLFDRHLDSRSLAIHAGAAVVAAIAVSVLLFSSFLHHWQGPVDSLTTYLAYLHRAGGADSAAHHHPFWFYLDLLTFSQPVPNLTWGEDLILVCGVVGAGAAWWLPQRLHGHTPAIRVLSLYTVLLTLIYSVIPYKTPWCMLSFLHGLILLAGVGAQVLLTWSRRLWIRLALAACLGLAVLQLGQRAVLASYRYPAHARNPYVYAQTGVDFLRLVEHVERVAAATGGRSRLAIRVIAPADQTWPLPWYLRAYPDTGYWHQWSEDAVAGTPDVIIAAIDMEERLPEAITEAYVPNYYGLRPEVLLSAYFHPTAWERFLEAQDGQ